MKSPIILLAPILIVSFLSLWILDDRQTEINTLESILKQRNERIAKDSVLLRHVSERSLRYEIIAFELNEITDLFQSSRNEKLKRKELITMMNNLN